MTDHPPAIPAIPCDRCGTTSKTARGTCLICELRSGGPSDRLCSMCGEPDFPDERKTCKCGLSPEQPARCGGTET